MDKVSNHSLEKHASTDDSSSGSFNDPYLEKRVWRKLDIFILPVVAMFYFLSFLVCDHFDYLR